MTPFIGYMSEGSFLGMLSSIPFVLLLVEQFDAFRVGVVVCLLS